MPSPSGPTVRRSPTPSAPPGGGALASAAGRGGSRAAAAGGGERGGGGGRGRWVDARAWLPDGGRLVVAGEEGATRLWDAVRARELRRYTGHRALALAVA